jgi:uncharacterized protein (TIGR02246 family)
MGRLRISMDEDEQAIRDLVATWMSASAAGDRDRVLDLMADDAVFLLPGRSPIRGKAAFAAAQDALKGMRIEAVSDIQEVRVFGDWAYCWNHLAVEVHRPGGGVPVKRAGPVLSILRKLPDGRWVIVRDANMLSSVAE